MRLWGSSWAHRKGSKLPQFWKSCTVFRLNIGLIIRCCSMSVKLTMVWPHNILWIWFIWILVDLKDHLLLAILKTPLKNRGDQAFSDAGPRLWKKKEDLYPQLTFLNLKWKHICSLWLLNVDFFEVILCFIFSSMLFFSVIIDFLSFCSVLLLFVGFYCTALWSTL